MVEEPARGLEHEAGLPGPARADEGDEPVALDQRRDLRQLLLPADEARQRERQVGAARAQRAERREVSWEVGHDQLVDLLGPVDVPQPVRAEIDELDRCSEPVAGEIGGDRRADDLAAVPDGQDPRHPVERRAEVIAIAGLRGPDVERHPHPERAGLAPGRVAERSLGGECRVNCVDRIVEHGQHPVAGRLDHRATARLDGHAQEVIVLGEGPTHRTSALLPETRAPLDVREQEGGRRTLGDGARCGRCRAGSLRHGLLHDQHGRDAATLGQARTLGPA